MGSYFDNNFRLHADMYFHISDFKNESTQEEHVFRQHYVYIASNMQFQHLNKKIQLYQEQQGRYHNGLHHHCKKLTIIIKCRFICTTRRFKSENSRQYWRVGENQNSERKYRLDTFINNDKILR